MTQFVWKDIGSDNWDGTFGEQSNRPVSEGANNTMVRLDCYVGTMKIGSLYAVSSYYRINHEDEWMTEARFMLRKSAKSFGTYPNKSSNLQAMKDWVEGEFEKFRKATGL